MTTKATCQTCFCGRKKAAADNAEKASRRTDNYFGLAVFSLLTFFGLTLIFC